MRKAVFNLESDEIIIYYHFKEGQIFRKPSHYNRNELRNSGNQGEMNEKDQGDESKQQQEFNNINQMERLCF
jgi:hypothetical protein